MGRKANPKLIGAFVLGGLALLGLGVLVFGGARWFGERSIYVAYFPGSVKGLQVGAPVDFRGVTIGQVTEIRIRYDASDGSLQIPVLMALNPERITVVGEDPAAEVPDDFEDLIDRGLRAQLQVQSIVTGLLFIELDFYPQAPLNLVGAEDGYPEVPTIPSTMEQLEQTLGDVTQQVPELLRNVNALLAQVSTGLGEEGQVQKILDDLATFTTSLNNAAPMLDQLVENATEAVAALRRSAAATNEILLANEEEIGASLEELEATLAAVRRMADQVNLVIAENREGLQDFTTGGLYEITGLAQDAQRMVDQITRVAEELERDPARFLFGDRTEGIRP
ncbi:MAG TPA: MlaD family protein [Geminicoccaceae bacterium]|nr:MlaD family protein [Geminicoccaceae bacterium]